MWFYFRNNFEKFLASEDKELQLPPLKAFQRKLVYEMTRLKLVISVFKFASRFFSWHFAVSSILGRFPSQIVIETRTDEASRRFQVATRISSEEDRIETLHKRRDRELVCSPLLPSPEPD